LEFINKFYKLDSMKVDNNILQDYYNSPQTDPRVEANRQAPLEKEVEEAPKVEAQKGSKGLQKEVLGITSLNQSQLSNRETAQKQLKNGYLDITI